MSFDPLNPGPGENHSDDWDDKELESSSPSPEGENHFLPMVPCLRCGLLIDSTLTCPHCFAPPKGGTLSSILKANPVYSFPLIGKILIGFVLQIIPSMILGWILMSGRLENEKEKQTAILILEGWDLLVVLAVFAWVGRVPLKKPFKKVRLISWSLMPLILGMALTLNIAYHQVLTEFLKIKVEKNFDWTPLWIFMVAVQPALVEELFFRYLALGSLCEIMGIHPAVFVSSVLFAMAHIFVPLSLPVLFFLGLILGYLRVASGGLLLPMLFHFFHNLAVLWLEAHKWP